jgi:hypothetical protein
MKNLRENGMKAGLVICLVVGLVAVGCGDGQDNSEKVDGLYDVTEWTLSEGSCSLEGDSISEWQPDRVSLRAQDAPYPHLKMVLCTAGEPCDASRENFDSFAWRLEQICSEGGWEGTQVHFEDMGDGCSGYREEVSVSCGEAGRIRIEIREFESVEFDKSVDNLPCGDSGDCPEVDLPATCNAKDARAATASAPCANLQVIQAELAMPYTGATRADGLFPDADDPTHHAK